MRLRVSAREENLGRGDPAEQIPGAKATEELFSRVMFFVKPMSSLAMRILIVVLKAYFLFHYFF